MNAFRKDRSLAEGRDAVMRVMSLILDGMALHTVVHDVEDHRFFQETIRHYQRQLPDCLEAPPAMLAAAGSIIQAFEQYNRSVTRQFVGGRSALKEMVELLSHTLKETCKGNPKVAACLTEIEIQLRPAFQLEEIRALKGRLETCLASLQTEERVEDAPPPEPPADDPPPETGLPGIAEGRAYLESLAGSEAAHYAVGISLNRFSTVKTRFGQKAAEDYLMAACQAIAQRLDDRDQLFQWGSRSFVAVLERAGSLESVQVEARKLAGSDRLHTFTVGERNVLVPITLSSLCLPVQDSPDVATLLAKIDAFLSQAVG